MVCMCLTMRNRTNTGACFLLVSLLSSERAVDDAATICSICEGILDQKICFLVFSLILT